MRRMLEDYNELVGVLTSRHNRSIHRSGTIQEIGATCLFLASKTEENGKRLEDIVTVMLAKVHGIAPAEVEGMYDTVSDAVNGHLHLI
jgi:Cyclin, N-terminal domain